MTKKTKAKKRTKRIRTYLKEFDVFLKILIDNKLKVSDIYYLEETYSRLINEIPEPKKTISIIKQYNTLVENLSMFEDEIKYLNNVIAEEQNTNNKVRINKYKIKELKKELEIISKEERKQKEIYDTKIEPLYLNLLNELDEVFVKSLKEFFNFYYTVTNFYYIINLNSIPENNYKINNYFSEEEKFRTVVYQSINNMYTFLRGLKLF